MRVLSGGPACFTLTASREASACALPRAKPSRKPPIWWLLANENSSTQRSAAPGRASGELAVPGSSNTCRAGSHTDTCLQSNC